MLIKKITIVIVFSALLIAGCIKENSSKVIVKNVTQSQNAHQTFAANEFISRDGKLSFTHQKDWLCREIVYGVRVDCYPKDRQAEENDIGLDQVTVLYPDISIFTEGCSAKEIPVYEKDPDSIEIHSFIKSYNGCSVLIDTENKNIDSEKKLDKIIFPS